MPDTVSVERLSALEAVYETGTFGAETPDGPGVTFAERRPLTLVHIAGNPSDSGFANGVAKTTGVALPTEPNTFNEHEGTSIIWLAPERWLVVRPDDGHPYALEHAIREACPDTAVVDVSHGRTVIRVSGPKARTVMMKGAPLDFHARVFTPGRSAETAISQCTVFIACVSDDAFDVYVFRAFGQHMWEFLTESAEEFGYRVSEPVTG